MLKHFHNFKVIMLESFKTYIIPSSKSTTQIVNFNKKKLKRSCVLHGVCVCVCVCVKLCLARYLCVLFLVL